jgi:hypothetical protein
MVYVNLIVENKNKSEIASLTFIAPLPSEMSRDCECSKDIPLCNLDSSTGLDYRRYRYRLKITIADRLTLFTL